MIIGLVGRCGDRCRLLHQLDRHDPGLLRAVVADLDLTDLLHEDLALLKGKSLFDRVSELHISRPRSKEEMVSLLSA